MTPAFTVVHGTVAGFWIEERGLVVHLEAGGQPVVVYVPSWRPDFLGQVELVKYALSVNDDHDTRAANGFEPMPRKQVWARVAQASPDPSATVHASEPMLAAALGIGAGGSDPLTSPAARS